VSETANVVRLTDWSGGGGADAAPLLGREWLVTNGLGGYASATVAGVGTRRYHGLLVAALPAPLGRAVMLNHLSEELTLPDGTVLRFGGREEVGGRLDLHGVEHLRRFRLENGLPVWTYAVDGFTLERRVLMPYEQNTVHVAYRLLGGEGTVRLRLRPSVHFRRQEHPVSTPLQRRYRLSAEDRRLEVTAADDADFPPLRLYLHAGAPSFTIDPVEVTEILYRVEKDRGYEDQGALWSPGYFGADLTAGTDAVLVASTEPWDSVLAQSPGATAEAEQRRRTELLARAAPAARTGVPAELVLAADQFLVTPGYREPATAAGGEAGTRIRTVIAGYHWFTDWGRDTMISLEGLTLATGRAEEAACILRTFARYVRDGLIPNMFPDGAAEGLYHTADATLWFFHAVHRYVSLTGDRDLLRDLLPVLRDVVRHHLRGTRFGIGVDPEDGLLRQGAEGYQLTWMDAKVDGWVVTPRRGKAVEINALWHNALRLLEVWLRDEGHAAAATEVEGHAARAYDSFNRRFWNPGRGHLFDVVDGPGGEDPACRPNQVFAISLDHPVLDPARWPAVMDAVRERLLTPFGLRSLAPGEPDYKPNYHGDLRTRDAAYHQGTVWGWLIGPYIDAHLRVHPEDRAGAAALLDGMARHLADFGVGSIAEIFDAEPPFTPRGCIAQAWSVAETLRCWLATGKEAGEVGPLSPGG
jgi:predicted glycogen debranching enzyme